mmetsp:Transcript_11670/g.16538  ORF Transcript_11670/g.16538 Transcript_11670/m.16538 type:complete len:150 (-) Transcript_11670:707-1156(-)
MLTLTKWQSLCMLKLKACKNKYYQSFMTTDETGTQTINSDMSQDKKASLFSLLHDALPASNLNLEFITDRMIQQAGGAQLWTQCAERFAPTKKRYYDKEEMKADFNNLSKNDKESNSNFLKRLETKANELDREGIVLTPHVKALTLLRG